MNPTQTPVKGIVWDNESVLVSPNWNTCYDKAYELLGLEAPMGGDPARGKTYKKMLSVPVTAELVAGAPSFEEGLEENNFLQSYSSGHINAQDFWPIACEHGFCLEPTSENIEAIRVAQTFLVRNPDGSVKTIPAVIDLMNRLARDIPQFMLSNTNQEIYDGFKEASYMNAIPEDARFFSIFLKCRKPADEIYKIAIERSGLKAEELLFIDDKDANIEGAIRNGMQGVLFNGQKEPVEVLRQKLAERGVTVQ